MAEGSLSGGLRRPTRHPPVGLIALAVLASGRPLLSQEPVRPDTVPADSLVEVVPDSVREALRQERPPPVTAFPERRLPRRGGVAVYECDRECVQSSTAISLLELLLDVAPGVTGLRPGFFSGPQYALHGPYGPGFVRLFVDGREILSLETRQTDLRRVTLANLERVRILRDADGLVIDVDLLRHASPDAYSRISGGTGEPNLQILDGLFASGLGRRFVVEGGFELLEASFSGARNDRFGAWARLSWMPSSNRFGLSFEYRTETLQRTAADTTDFGRGGLTLRARADLSDAVQLDAFAATEGFKLDASGFAEGEEVPERDVETLGVGLSVTPGRLDVGVGVRLAGGAAYPSLAGHLTTGFRLGAGARIEAAGELARWEEFSTSEARVALSFADTLLLPFDVRVDASRGLRGIPYPLGESADSVGFRALGLAAGLEVGPYRLDGRYGIQHLSRALVFGAGFDSLVQVGPDEVDVDSWEVGLEGPLIPLGAVIRGLAPIRLRGFWRHHDPGDDGPLFTPAHVARAELRFHDTFFDGNLEIWLSGFLERHGVFRSAESGAPDPVSLTGYTWPGGHFMFKIGDFRFFWRLTNPAGVSVADVVGAEYPVLVNLFGVRWEFFN